MTQEVRPYLEASYLGAIRGLLGLPIEHPFDAIKTKCQAEGGLRSVRTVTKSMWAEAGVRGFYTGAIPNATRVAIKQMYRWPMMLAFPSWYGKHLPQPVIETFPSAAKVATGLSIATLEVGVLTPLERIKVFLMTRPLNGPGIRGFLSANRGHVGKELSRGLNALFLKQMMSWVTFLVTDEKAKTQEKKRLGTNVLPFPSLMKVSAIVGGVNTAANMPFDTVKTHLTKANRMNHEKLMQILRRSIQLYGIKGLYAGWQARLIQYMVQASITVPLLDHLETRYSGGDGAST